MKPSNSAKLSQFSLKGSISAASSNLNSLLLRKKQGVCSRAGNDDADDEEQ